MSNTIKRIRGFVKGGRGVFACDQCGKLTRQTDNNSDYCKKCYEQLECENE